MSANSKIFRAEALEQLNSPEQLEQLLKVTDKRAWISIFTLALLLLSTVVWGIFGQIPITVDGTGILIFPRRVASFQAPSQGQIENLYVTVGSSVREGDVIGTISQPGLLGQLEAEREKYTRLLQRNERIEALSGQRGVLERDAIASQRKLLEERIESTRSNANAQLTNSIKFINNQLKNVDNVLDQQRALEKNFRERYETFLQLKSEGLSSEETVLNARQRLIDNQLKSSELRLRREEITLSKAQADDTFRGQMQQLAEMESQLQDLKIQENQLVQSGLETKADRELQIKSVETKVAQLEEELAVRGQIISEHDGRILELTLGEGQFIGVGRRLGSIEAENTDRELVGIAYMRVGDGKKVKPDMDIRITPTNVQRERHGSIEAKVAEVTPFPVTSEAAASLIGSETVARDLLQNTSKIQITARLLPDSGSVSGFKWTSGTGPPDNVSSGTTTFVRATVEYRRPITFVIPLLRKWTGV